MTGKTLGDYELIRELGRGGMGVVYLAEHKRLKNRYAIKVLPEELKKDEQFIQRFHIEAGVMARLDHPNVVRVHNMGREGDTYYIVMEYIHDADGETRTLEDIIKEKKELSQEDVKDILLQVCDGLIYAHHYRDDQIKDGVIHRDIKPGNIFIRNGREVKISDFGLARIVGNEYLSSKIHESISISIASRTLSGDKTTAEAAESGQKPTLSGGKTKTPTPAYKKTSTGALLGTYDFMSPEQKRGEEADKRSDVYALGVLIYKTLTGDLPTGAFPYPSEIKGALSRKWDMIIRKSLQKEQSNRYQSVDELRSILEGIGRRSAKRLVGIIAASVLVLALMGIFFLVKKDSVPPPQFPNKTVSQVLAPVSEPTPVLPKPTSTPMPLKSTKTPPTPSPSTPTPTPSPTPPPNSSPTVSPKGETAAWEALGKLETLAGNATSERRIAMYGSFIKEWSNTAASKEAEKALKEERARQEKLKAADAAYSEAQRKESDNNLSAGEKKGLWDRFLRDYENIYDKGDAKIAAAKQRSEYWTNWRPPTPTPTPTPTPIPTQDYEEDLGGGMKLKMIWIKGGSFDMGSPENENDDSPVHRVVLDGFWMSETEVTIGQFQKFVEETQYNTDAESGAGPNGQGARILNAEGDYEWDKSGDWKNPGFSQEENYPVVCVSWNDSKAFCEWLSQKGKGIYTLPTEAQWEYACRSGTNTAYFWGDDPNKGLGWCNGFDESASVALSSKKRKYLSGFRTFNWDDGYVFTSPVKRFKQNSNKLYDMHGNVSEWCLDWYDEKFYVKPEATKRNPLNEKSGKFRVLRGGSWYLSPGYIQSANREGVDPSLRVDSVGFRVCRLSR